MRKYMKMMMMAAACLVLAIGCGGRGESAQPPVQERYASCFHIIPDSSMIVSISPHDGMRDTLRLSGPVRRLVCMSSSYVGFLDALGVDSVVVGVSGVDYVSDEYVRAHAVEVGYEAALDYEAILSLRPDVLLTFTVSAAEPAYVAKLRELGVRVFVLYEHLESHPLARAEYIRLLGAMTGRMAEADSIFAAVEGHYLALAGASASGIPASQVDSAALAANAGGRALADAGEPKGEAAAPPRKVLLNIPYADQWYVPGRDNYMTRLISDAGGEVLGAEPGSESTVISMERAIQIASEADFWLNTGWCASKADLYGVNSLFRGFPSAVYNNNLRLTPQGGNDFWESGVVRPDLILEDLIRIFSGSAPADSLHYYRRLE